MLVELTIKNFAIIDSLSISFDKGLTVLTGETGAGKSIIIDAIHLLAGGRGSSDLVRYGEKRAEIEGLFLLDDNAQSCYNKAAEFGIEISDGMVVLHRDMYTTGKSVCRVNGKLVTIATLREIGATLVDIHGQHEHQELMIADNHSYLLDQYGGKNIKSALNEYEVLYKKYVNLTNKLQKLSDNEQEMAHRLDLIQFQSKEIQEANLVQNEDDELLDEKMKISNFEKIYEALHNTYQSLLGEQRGLDWLGLAMNHLDGVSTYDANLKEAFETISNSYYLVEEISYKIRNQLDELEYDPDRLNFIEGRLNELNHLKRKYGRTVQDILEYAATIEEEIDTIQNRDSHVLQLKKDLEGISADLLLEAKNLSVLRKQYADLLIKDIKRELKHLYMDKTTFDVALSKKEGIHETSFANEIPVKYKKNGIDEVEFFISTNPGEPLKPLSKVASGGELSRIMLAIKSIFSKHQGVTSIIFDEVDTGVSGRVAQAIAEKIYHVSVGSQVLCISHLPQVAAMADTHLFISKNTSQDRTTTKVTHLNKNEKIKEIGRMISGVEITDLTKKHAKELLDLAKNLKNA
ncbi:DNA repair protein RecN [Cytobacillus sp. Hm23]